jgi:hypothetical protein
MLWGAVTSATAQVSVGIGLPGVSIGINLPVYPQLVQVPGYPVYYAPNLNSNFFFYDGMYWVYQGDNWYSSTWYNGPWGMVGPQAVPLFVLRIPVSYYRAPPPYFRGWQGNAPPRWGEHWGNDWEQQRRGWDQWNHNAVPARAPLPTYQRQYSGDRYPHQAEQQQALRNQNYRYQPRDPEVRQHYQEQPAQRSPAPSQQGRAAAPQDRGGKPQDVQHSSPPPKAGKEPDRPAPTQAAPRPAPAQQGRAAAPQDRGGKPQDVQHSSPPPKAGKEPDRPAPTQAAPQPRSPTAQVQKQPPNQASAQREQPAPMQQGKGAPQDAKRGQGQDKESDKGEGRNKP